MIDAPVAMARQIPQGNHMPSIRTSNEKAMGILHYSSPFDTGLECDLRKRWTDFLVNEIREDGTVLHLTELSNNSDVSPRPSGPVASSTDQSRHSSGQSSLASTGNSDATEPSKEDKDTLNKLVGEETTQSLIQLDLAIQNAKGIKAKILGVTNVKFTNVIDRETRKAVHEQIRRIFSSRISTVTDVSGIITAEPMKLASSKGRNGYRDPRNSKFGQVPGRYLHFTLYKENKDTMDAINHIARLLKIKATNFGFAGTKDRRAATVQRMSVFGQRVENMTWLNNNRVIGVKIGNFEYRPVEMKLGQHGGNEFVITLKNCQIQRVKDFSVAGQVDYIEQAVEMALSQMTRRGFINYFGLQRFGTHTVGTHELGLKILKGDFAGVIEGLLHVDRDLMSAALVNTAAAEKTFNPDEVARARAIGVWRTSGKANAALEIMPKRFSAETNIIRHLGRPESKKDFQGALLSVTRGMRMMYIHAYQSYVWNHVASCRWSKFGPQVIVGDLVLESSEDTDVQGPAKKTAEDDEHDLDQEQGFFFTKARILTQEDVKSGRYSIFDVVLPTPGFDIVYPDGAVGEYFKEFMGREENGGLDPYNMYRPQKEFRLSGSYRYLIGRFIGKPAFLVRTYADDSEQMYPTDLDLLNQKKAESNARNSKAAESSSKPSQSKAETPEESLRLQKNAAWHEFAQNAQKYDEEEVHAQRRLRELKPRPEGGTQVRETWNQHVVNGNKRLKVAQHVDIFSWDNEYKPAAAVSAAEFPSSGDAMMQFDNAAQDSFWGAPLQPEQIEPTTSNVLSEGKDSVDSPTSAALPTPNAMPKAVDNWTRKAAQASLGFRPSSPDLLLDFEPASAGPSQPATSQSNLLIPGLAGTEVSTSVSPVVTANEVPSVPPTQPPIAATFPELRVIGGEDMKSPLATPSPKPSAGDNKKHKGNKIAVVLKFSLRPSNYATIALREIIGTVPETKAGDMTRPKSS